MATSKNKKRDAYLQRTYGINSRQYAIMLRMQHGRCAICTRKPKSGKRLHVDHDHRTDVVRGLLCFYCNKFIVGRHSVDTARKLFAYLDRDFDGRKIEETASPTVRKRRAAVPTMQKEFLSSQDA